MIKQIFRKWLGIEAIESKMPKQASQAELRLMIGEAISDALNGKNDGPWGNVFYSYKIPNLLERALEKAARSTAIDAANFEVRSTVGTESFIDDVVSRIQRKQLGK